MQHLKIYQYSKKESPKGSLKVYLIIYTHRHKRGIVAAGAVEIRVGIREEAWWRVARGDLFAWPNIEHVRGV